MKNYQLFLTELHKQKQKKIYIYIYMYFFVFLCLCVFVLQMNINIEREAFQMDKFRHISPQNLHTPHLYFHFLSPTKYSEQ
jgi:hypothetical protein